MKLWKNFDRLRHDQSATDRNLLFLPRRHVSMAKEPLQGAPVHSTIGDHRIQRNMFPPAEIEFLAYPL